MADCAGDAVSTVASPAAVAPGSLEDRATAAATSSGEEVTGSGSIAAVGGVEAGAAGTSAAFSSADRLR
ncbi:hypothetical protein ACRAWC_17205 [Leifsonia sp. L25]|uniref:hypothetical protein n=1 Tax=Leifsonia sp. L25 TaxID=3423957 RepID=UPI003D684533